MNSTEVYRRRKQNGICTQCGKKPPVEGKTMCAECAEQRRIYQRETRKFLLQFELCPKCGKNKLFGDEKNCPECRAAFANRQMKYREKNQEEYNEKQRIEHRAIYGKRKEQGICVRCGKRKPKNGYSTCEICQQKDRERKRIMYGYGTHDRHERLKYGLCYFCDNPVKDGYKVCEKHYQMNLQKLNNDKCRQATQELKKMGQISSRKGSARCEGSAN